MSLPPFTTVVHTSQAALSAYASYYTYLSIIKTQTYEEQTKKAAKYSNTAEHHLWKTRKTLGGGAIGIFASLVTSITLVSSTSASILSSSSSSTSSSDPSTPPAILAITSLGLALYLTISHSHISNYWRGSPKIPAPGMSDYNDAISTTAVMRASIGLLGVSWGLVGGWYLWSALF